MPAQVQANIQNSLNRKGTTDTTKDSISDTKPVPVPVVVKTVLEESVGTFALPIVDFAPFLNDSNPDAALQEQVAQAIDQACRSHGFVCLRNTGITRHALRGGFDASKSLFQGLDQKEKEQLKPLDPATNTGFNGFGSEALNVRRRPDLKEVFNVRQPKQNEALFQGTPHGFRQAATELWEQTTVLTHRFAKCCAMALLQDDNELDYFSKTLKDMDLCTLRMLHYPPCSDDALHDPTDVESAIRVGEHTDFGAYTFLFVDNPRDESSHGLQVKPVEGGDLGRGSLVARDDSVFTSGWQDVIFDDKTLDEMEQDETCPVLVNTGALMARWTNDTWRATAHRVVVKPQAKHSTRYSIAVFIDPDKSTMCSVHPKFVPEGQEPKYPPINSLDYLLMKLEEVQGVGGKENKEGGGKGSVEG